MRRCYQTDSQQHACSAGQFRSSDYIKVCSSLTASTAAPAVRRALPNAWLGGKLADVGQGHAERLLGEHPPGLVGRTAAAIRNPRRRQGMLQGVRPSSAAPQSPGIFVNRHVIRLDDRADAAFAD